MQPRTSSPVPRASSASAPAIVHPSVAAPPPRSRASSRKIAWLDGLTRTVIVAVVTFAAVLSFAGAAFAGGWANVANVDACAAAPAASARGPMPGDASPVADDPFTRSYVVGA